LCFRILIDCRCVAAAAAPSPTASEVAISWWEALLPRFISFNIPQIWEVSKNTDCTWATAGFSPGCLFREKGHLANLSPPEHYMTIETTCIFRCQNHCCSTEKTSTREKDIPNWEGGNKPTISARNRCPCLVTISTQKFRITCKTEQTHWPSPADFHGSLHEHLLHV
jgi:hypothetical protein